MLTYAQVLALALSALPAANARCCALKLHFVPGKLTGPVKNFWFCGRSGGEGLLHLG